MSPESLNEQKADQKLQEGVGEPSSDTTGKNRPVKADREANHAGPNQRSNREDIEGEDRRFEQWSSGKTGDLMILTRSANMPSCRTSVVISAS